MNLLSYLGRLVIRFIEHVGQLSILIGRLAGAIYLFPRNLHLIFVQMLHMGVNSLPLVLFTSLFTGGVTAVQAAYQFRGLVPMSYLGGAVGKAVVIELGPVLTALVIAGRVGASIAAELGTMKVTEQIDALEVMAIDPVRYLILPRFISGVIMLPVLTIFSDFIAIIGGLAVSVWFLDLSTYSFLNSLKMFFDLQDLFGGLLKSVAFGAIISIIGCYNGFITSGGAEGVGKSTTRAVVVSSILILLADYGIASLVFG